MNSVPTLPPVGSAGQTPSHLGTVLVVDDFAPLCDWVARHLSVTGYRVLFAYDALEARRILESSAGRGVDLMLVDVEMPAIRGDEPAQWFMQDRPEAEVLFMSHRPVHLPQVCNAGVLQKPFNLAELGTAVRCALAHHFATAKAGSVAA